jgi:hypothetical protein
LPCLVSSGKRTAVFNGDKRFFGLGLNAGNYDVSSFSQGTAAFADELKNVFIPTPESGVKREVEWVFRILKAELEFRADRRAIGTGDRYKLVSKSGFDDVKGPFALYDVVAMDVKI